MLIYSFFGMITFVASNQFYGCQTVNRIFLNKFLQIATEAGQIVLENGGETYRVEDTIQRFGDYFGAKETHSFVTPTGMFTTMVNDDMETFTLVKRITQRTINLDKVNKINNLSRTLEEEKPSFEEVEAELLSIKNDTGYSESLRVVVAAFSAACFTLLFDGDWMDFMVTLPIGTVIMLIKPYFTEMKFAQFFYNLIGGAIAMLMAIIFVELGVGHHVDKIVIGSIMLLVPGMAITNAIRDTMSGDLVSGLTRGLEAFIVAVAIAAGTGIVSGVWLN